MYLRGSKWSMNKRRSRPNWFLIILLSLIVLGASYVTRYVVPTVEPIGVPSPTPTTSPDSLIADAESLFNEGKLIPAIDAYRSAIVARPADPATHVMLARTLVFAGKYEEAQTSAEDALLLNPTNSMAFAVRGWALGFQEKYVEAEEDIKRALELDPNNAMAHAYYVEILVDSSFSGLAPLGTLERAIEESKIAQALAPNTLETHRARGYVLEATGNYKEAIVEYEAAIAINSKIADLYISLGRNYRTLGANDKAVEAFTNAIAFNPEDATPHLFLSRTYATVGEYGQALQYAETAVKISPTDTNLRGNLGVMYFQNSYLQEAAQELSYVTRGGLSEDGHEMNVIPLDPNSSRIAEYYYTYAAALSMIGKCGEALEMTQLIISRIPNNEFAMESVNKTITRCESNLSAPPATGTPDPTAEAEATPTP